MPKRLGIVPPSTAVVVDYDEPPLAPGEVRVQTELASTKHGTNLAFFTGANFADMRFDPQRHLFVPSAPNHLAPSTARPVLNAMGVGVVSEVGVGVTAWRVGDRVFGAMDIRETNVCRADSLWALGEIEPELALCLEPAYVAFFSLRESGVQFGDSVAVVGLGAIGLLTVRMACLSGAETVIAIDPLPNRRACAQRLGADHVLDPKVSDAGEVVHDLTGGQGVDVAIEAAGVYAALQDAIRCTRVGGTVCMTGFYQGPAQDVWFGREAHHNRLTFIVPHGCGWANQPRDHPRWDRQRAEGVLVSLMRQKKLTAPGLLAPIVSLAEAPRVWQWIAEDPGKVIKFGVRF